MATTTQQLPLKPDSLKRRTSGNCRYYKARTTLVVKRATSSVMALYKGLKIVPFVPPLDGDCGNLYKAVKKFLSIEVSPEPEIQMAFQSIKKLLPSACKCLRGSMLSDLHTRLTRSPPRLSPAYLANCRRVLSEIFTDGWDKSWWGKTRSFTPSLGSCVNSGRSKGGQLSALAEEGHEAWLESLYLPKGELKGELLLVDSSGKPRPLTKFECSSSVLRPLHGIIYDKISQCKWLLRGDVSTEKLWDAGFRENGGSLVSGDYVSASDNLPIEIAELILDFAWSKSKHVPAAIWRYAVAAQRPSLTYEDEDHLKSDFIPTLGQMMGSYLCFPLLCLQNYLAFRWALACAELNVDDVPVLINGDDILYQIQDVKFFSIWVQKIMEVGFEVEQSKTSVSSLYGSINSTLVRWGGGKLRVRRTYRMGMLRPPEHPSNLGSSFETFSKVGSPRDWYRAGLVFLDWHRRTIVTWFASAQEYGFFGRLARSCWKGAFGGLLWAREAFRSKIDLPPLQPAPCPHSIVMKGTEFLSFPPEEVDLVGQRKIAEWMAARKWELGRTFKRTKSRDWLKDRQSQVLTIANRNWFTSIGSIRRVVRLWSDELVKLGRELCSPKRTLYGPPKTYDQRWSREGDKLPTRPTSDGVLVLNQSPSRFFPRGFSTPNEVNLCVSKRYIPGESVWKRRPKSQDVRVPLPLLEELGLKVSCSSPGEIVGWLGPKYGKGWRMLYGNASALNGDDLEGLYNPIVQAPCIMVTGPTL